MARQNKTMKPRRVEVKIAETAASDGKVFKQNRTVLEAEVAPIVAALDGISSQEQVEIYN